MWLGRVCDNRGGKKKRELKTLSSIRNRKSIAVPKTLNKKKEEKKKEEEEEINRRRKRKKGSKEGMQACHLKTSEAKVAALVKKK